MLVFFFLKDGPRFVPWLSAQTGPRAARHVAALSYKTWDTLSEFIRQQALVGFIDAFFIGLGLWILGVPLVLPLAVLTFFGGFIPIIGAFVAGAFAVLIALVSNGFTTALIVLGIVILVQQIEGNVLQPIIQGRGFNLHAGVVILAVTAGSSLAGIIGAFLSVPIAALIAVIYRYVRDELDEPLARGRRRRHRRPGSRATTTGAEIVQEQVAAPGGRPGAAAGQRPAALNAPSGGRMGNAATRRARLHAAHRPHIVKEVPPWPSDRRSSSSCSPRRSASSAGRQRSATRPSAAGWCWCTTWPATSTPRTPARLAGAHLLAGLPHEVIARFDVDSLVDYRAHRPRMRFSGDRYESFAAPEILLYALEDDAGRAVPAAARRRARLRVGAVRRRGRPGSSSGSASPRWWPCRRSRCRCRTPGR